MKLELETGPQNETLKKKAQPVDLSEPGFDVEELIVKMYSKMEMEDGVGLAAPQIGKSIQLSVIRTGKDELVLINPEITLYSKDKKEEKEGCLSLPNKEYKVLRAKKIHCKYYDLEGNKKRIKAKGILAQVIQHEIDHLNGILICDRAQELKK